MPTFFLYDLMHLLCLSCDIRGKEIFNYLENNTMRCSVGFDLFRNTWFAFDDDSNDTLDNSE